MNIAAFMCDQAPCGRLVSVDEADELGIILYECPECGTRDGEVAGPACDCGAERERLGFACPACDDGVLRPLYEAVVAWGDGTQQVGDAMSGCNRTSCAWCWHLPVKWLAGLLWRCERIPLGRLAPHVLGTAICAERWERIDHKREEKKP